jgi:GNAT superfamily N-acetyltransferase
MDWPCSINTGAQLSRLPSFCLLFCTAAYGLEYVHIVLAQLDDVPAWLQLAGEVEFLFGPLVHEPAFHRALHNNIARGTAFCVRETDGSTGSPLLGGLLFSPQPPMYKIGWLAVTNQYRRRGIGQCLVEFVIHRVQPPAELVAITFGADVEAGHPARQFYTRMGFVAAEHAPNGPEGSSRQVFRRIFP